MAAASKATALAGTADMPVPEAPARSAETAAARPAAPLPTTSTSKEARWRMGMMLAQILIPVITDRYRMLLNPNEGYTPPLMGTLGEIVKPTFITVAPEDTLGEVAERMSAQNVGAVVVKDFGRLIGVLTERDMLRAMAARVHTSDARVRQWMTENPITASPDTTFDEAQQVMLDKGFRHLPVVEGDTILGIVSLRRIMGGRRPTAD